MGDGLDSRGDPPETRAAIESGRARNLSSTSTIHPRMPLTRSPYLANQSARRNAQNRAYARLALKYLDPADPALAWLFPPGKPPRQKALEELGRIAVLDKESCHPM